jgi:hypothetical protein
MIIFVEAKGDEKAYMTGVVKRTMRVNDASD